MCDDYEHCECPRCEGDATAGECEQCGGEGFMDYMDCPESWGEDSPSEPNHMIECPSCHGHGGWICCPKCGERDA